MGSNTVIAIIPARGGSKGLPGKNIRILKDKPLIAWTIDAAIKSNIFKDIIVSTDDQTTAEIARTYGATVPFLRPDVLSRDNTSQVDVVEHVIYWLEQKSSLPDYVILLQPTSPLRDEKDIVNSFTYALHHNAQSVVSITSAQEHPYLAKKIDNAGIIEDFYLISEKPERRQDFPNAYILNGAIYIIKPKILLEKHTFTPPGTFGFIMPVTHSIDIDTLWDFTLAEFMIEHIAKEL